MATLAGFAAPEMNIFETDAEPSYLEGMSDQDIARFRAQAEECRRQAEHSVREADKAAWLRMAGEWTQLAQDAERHRGIR
jgi:hypothetical protein